jgi:hypothetical protein
MRLLVYVAFMVALAVAAQAEEIQTPKRPSLAAQVQAQAAQLTPASSQTGSWQARVSRSRGGGGSTMRAVMIGAIAGGAAGFLTGYALDNVSCKCGVGVYSGVGAAAGAGVGAGVGWVISLR